MASLYLLHFNNYYNKLVRYYDTLAEYLPYQIGDTLLNINFNPADGVNAKQIVNWDDDTPDYLIVVDGSVMSRWYVVEAQRTRGRQLELTLKRDVIADYRDAVLNAEAFCEKGWVNNSSPFVFNKENMGFNQIKTSETLLQNNLKTPWLVLYLSRYHTNDSGQYEYNEYTGEFIDETSINDADYVVNSLSDYKYYKYSQQAIDDGTGEQYHYDDDVNISFVTTMQVKRSGDTSWTTYDNDLRPNEFVHIRRRYDQEDLNWPSWTNDGWPRFPNNTNRAYWNSLMVVYHKGDTTEPVTGLPVNSYSGMGTQEGANILNSESGKTIRVGDKVYRIGVNTASQSKFRNYATVEQSTQLGLSMIQTCYTTVNINTANKTIPPMHVEWGDISPYVTMTFTEINLAQNTIKYDIQYQGGVTTDSAYEIIAAPYYDVSFVDGGTVFNHIGNIALQWFQDIINRYNGAGWAYDLQLVPYMSIDQTNITNLDKVYCTQGNPPDKINLAVAFKIPSASFNKTYPITLPDTGVTSKKIANETQLYRIVSPNGVGEYEFSPVKNNGFTQFEVDCTLIPFNPYIKINPVFGGLYGSDFNDFRGLICQGNFSLPILNDQWSTYQLNNKNYQAIFDRNIESQEYQNKWQLASNIAGIFTGGAGGAAAGGLIGGAPGAAVGGVLAGIGGIVDTVASQEMFKESIDRQKDLFGMELGTIKARAQSLSRGTSYNVNNKYFPYIEYYTCTEEELVALNNKLKYNGMTIGVIGTVQQFLNPDETSYYQGTLIEIDITDDAHMADEIARTLQGGIRFAVN